jgi:predicted DsbA family dithiol-disulfide isomerase
MRVDIWSDVVCPWCYVGKARFEHALADFDHRDEVEVAFHSYELDPTMPRGESGPLKEALARKFGASSDQIEAMEGRVAGLARDEGLEYRTDRSHGNTFDLHRLLHLAAAAGRGPAAVDAVNRANFARALPIFDPEVMVEVLAEAGVGEADTRRVLAGDDYADEVRADEAAARGLGITGVPFFVVDNRYGISGAQPTELFAKALRQAWDDSAEPAAAPS